MNTVELLRSFAPVFEKKIDKEYHIHLRFEVTSSHALELVDIIVKGGRVTVTKALSSSPEDVFVCHKDTLERLYTGTLPHINAFAQEPDETGEFNALIIVKNRTDDKRVYPGQTMSEKQTSFLVRFNTFIWYFNRHPLDEVSLDISGARTLHGVDAIALGGSKDKLHGSIHALFSVKLGEKFIQGAIKAGLLILSGEGRVQLDGHTYLLKEHHYYEIFPEEKPIFESTTNNRFDIFYIGLV